MKFFNGYCSPKKGHSSKHVCQKTKCDTNIRGSVLACKRQYGRWILDCSMNSEKAEDGGLKTGKDDSRFSSILLEAFYKEEAPALASLKFLLT